MVEVFDDFKMKDLSEKYPEYDSTSNDKLVEEYDRYDIEDYDSMSNESKERFEYIKDLIKTVRSIYKETSFIDEFPEYDKMDKEELNNAFQNFTRNEDNLSFEDIKRLSHIESIFEERGYTYLNTIVPGRLPSLIDISLKINSRHGEDAFTLSKFLEFIPRESDGPNSRELLSELKRDVKNGRELSWLFKNKRVIVTRGGGGKLIYTQNKKPEFQKNLQELTLENLQTVK